MNTARDLRLTQADPTAGEDRRARDSDAVAGLARTNAALREGGIDYQVEPGQDFDAKAFTKAALKRWQKVAARLAE